MHSPPRKVTVKDQQAWKIPPCISNWKNAKGYTIPLDKRLAADGRSLTQVCASLFCFAPSVACLKRGIFLFCLSPLKFLLPSLPASIDHC